MKNLSFAHCPSLFYTLKYFIGGILVVFPLFVNCQVDTWVQRNDIGTTIKKGPPYSLQASTFSFSIGNKGYVGIASDTSDITFVFEFDPATNNWTQKAGLPGQHRLSPIWFSIGSKGYVGGGTDYSTRYNDFWEFDPATDTWSRRADIPVGLSHSSGFSIADKGYAALGYATNSNSKELWQFDPVQNIWAKKANFPGQYREDQIAFSLNNKGYVGLGYFYTNGGGVGFCQDIWEYDPNENSWFRKTDYPGVHRYNRIGIGLNGKGYVGTGEKVYLETSTNEFWEFDPAANSWKRKNDFFDDARTSAARFVINNKLYVGFGQGRLGNINPGISTGTGVMNDLWEYNATNDIWNEKRFLKYEDARCSFKIAGKGFVLVNKYNYSIRKNQLALFAYDTAARTWDRKADFPSSDILWAMGSFTLGNKGYVVCGADIDFKVAYKDLYEYDSGLDKWTRKADFGGDARRNLVAFSINGKGYAGLGFGVKVENNLPGTYKLYDWWEYDPGINQWRKKAEFPISNSDEVTSFNTDSKGYVIVPGSPADKVFEFSPQANSWLQKNDFPGRPRSVALGTSIGNKGYVIGGIDDVPVQGYYAYLKDMWEYSSIDDSWTTEVEFLDTGRATKIGFIIGDKLFLGSGFTQTSYLNDWWEYQFSVKYHSVANGNWNNPATWLGNVVPASGANIIIRHNVVGNVNTTCNSLRIESPGELIVNTGIKITILQ